MDRVIEIRSISCPILDEDFLSFMHYGFIQFLFLAITIDSTVIYFIFQIYNFRMYSLFSGTIHIYSISRHLMSLGHSARVRFIARRDLPVVLCSF